MTRPSSTDSRLAAWLEDGPTSGPDDALADALARVRSTRQRPGWLDLLTGDTMDTTWRARPVLTARLTFVLLIAMLVLALTAGVAIVGSQINRGNDPNNGVNALPAITTPHTACPAGTQLKSGDIATFAGTGGPGSSGDGGQATAAAMQPWNGIAVDAQGVVFVSDGKAIRRIALDGVITTFVAGLTAANGLAFDAAGDLYVADDLAFIKKIDPSGNVTTVVGTGVPGSTGDEGPAVNAQIMASMIAVGPQGDLYFDDATNRYRTVDPAGIIHAFAGTGARGYSGDFGPATQATFAVDFGAVAADSAGDVYLGDSGNSVIRKVDPSGTITTVVGPAGFSDRSKELAVDRDGTLYFADWGTNLVGKLDASRRMGWVAGGGPGGPTGLETFWGDCGPAVRATMSGPTAIAVHDGLLYVVDSFNARVRVVVL